MAYEFPFTDGTSFTDGTGWTDMGVLPPLEITVVAATAIKSLSDLKGMILGNTAKRFSDAQLMQFIGLAETEMNDVLRLRSLEKSIQLSTRGGAALLPIDFRSMRVLYNAGSRQALEPVTADEMQQLQATVPSAGVPCRFATHGFVLSLWPVPPDDHGLVGWYYPDIVGLSDSQPLNMVLARYPHVYFACAMKYAERFLQNTALAAEWDAQFVRSVETLVGRDRMDRTGSGPLVGRYGRSSH